MSSSTCNICGVATTNWGMVSSRECEPCRKSEQALNRAEGEGMANKIMTEKLKAVFAHSAYLERVGAKPLCKAPLRTKARKAVGLPKWTGSN